MNILWSNRGFGRASFKFLLSVIGFFLAGTVSAFAATYYVSPTGNDVSGSGTESSPWNTLHKARNHVRTISVLTENIDIILKGGTYELPSTLTLNSSDSGRNGFTITYKAATGESPVISGGSVISNWSDANGDGIWEASVPAGSNSRQLYVNGQRATRARSVDGTGWSRNGSIGKYYAPSTANTWANQSDIELITAYRWKMNRGPISSISGGQATMNPTYWNLAKIGPYAILDGTAAHVDWVENAFELLDTEGEWYLNRSTSTLYYKPKVGELLTGSNKVEVVLPKIEKLIDANNVSMITLDGLSFKYGTWLHPSSDMGYVSIQSGAILKDSNYINVEDAFDGIEESEGNVHFENSSNIVVKNSTFQSLGATALRFGAKSQNNTVFNNAFTDISGSAIVLGALQEHHTISALAVKNNIIDNNLISNVALEYWDMVALKINYTEQTVIVNNTIHDLPSGAISTGWGWGRYDVVNFAFANDNTGKAFNSPTIAKNNVVYRNKIYDFTKKIGDTGGIYNLGATSGERIIENLIYSANSPHGGTSFSNAIYLDNGTREAEVAGNGSYSIANHGYFCNGCASYNTVGQDNITQTPVLSSGNYLYSSNSGSLSNMPSTLVANAGQLSSIISPRTVNDIVSSLPTALIPSALAITPTKGQVVGKSASASVNTNNAANAIDGDSTTSWDAGAGNTSGWWQVDLEGSSTIERIGIAFGKVNGDGSFNYNRSGIVFQIQTSDDATTWTDQTFYTNGGYNGSNINNTTSLTTTQGINDLLISGSPSARYVRINVTSSNNQDFGILRFKLTGSVSLGQNLATSGTATQSTTYSTFVASKAIDGNTSGNWGAGSVTHTDTGSQPYWTLDLGAVKNIDTIRLWNRSDCCSSRLVNFHVFVSDTAFTGISVANSQAQSGVLDSYNSGTAGATTDMKINRTGRYVRVQLANTATDGENVLSLAEVEVYGTNILTNIAPSGTATQSSTWSVYDASRAINSNTNGNWGSGEVTHTDLGSQGYWTLDLGSIKNIDTLKIWNRTDCCASRLTNFHVFVSDVPLTGTTVANSQSQTGVLDSHHSGTAGATSDVAINRTGRYVRIQLSNTAINGANVLSLAEVQVFGY